MKNSNERVRAEVDALIDDIAQIQREIGDPEISCQSEDREAFEIVRRIERRLRGIGSLPAEDDPTSEAAE